MSQSIPRDEQEPNEVHAESPEQQAAPTWFAQTYRETEQDHLVDQYRRLPVAAAQPDSEAYELYRKRMMERLRSQNETFGNRPPAAAGPAPVPNETQLRDRRLANRPQKNSGVMGRYVMAAGLLAVVAGGSAGFALTKYDDIKASFASMYQNSKGPVVAKPVAVAVLAPETTITKKPIGIATLKVADVTGSLNSMIPLMLQADPATATQQLALQISGLPKSAYLSKGTRTSDSTWLLKDGEENNLNLFVPTSDKPKFDMSVAAIETKTGELAAPVKEMTVALNDASLQIAPASAPPETSVVKTSQAELPAAIPVPEQPAAAKPMLSAEVTGLLQKGDSLFKSGDLVIARQFFARAFEMGAADGALGVARTYDPAIYKQMNVQGLAPDAELAAQWYGKAKAAGANSPPVASLP